MNRIVLALALLLAFVAGPAAAQGEGEQGEITLGQVVTACDAGNLDACVNGGVYMRGQVDAFASAFVDNSCFSTIFVPEICQNLEKLRPTMANFIVVSDRMLFKACEGRVIAGCTLGGQYAKRENQIGGPARGRVFYSMGCDLDDPGSCLELGRLLNGADEALRDPAAARAAYSKTCTLAKWTNACSEYALMVERGQGGPPDLATARELHRVNCDGSDYYSCYRLAFLHRDGKGGAADTAEAIRLFDRVCFSRRREYPGACAERDRLKGASVLANPPVLAAPE